jgi:sterol desaturase/sphingolipid hydroxylase (fatty acid hydroxylase superfamily)
MFTPWSVGCFLAFGLLFTALELVRPARRIDYRAALKNDVGALAAYQLAFAPGAFYISTWLAPSDHSGFQAFVGLPWYVRLALYIALTDLGSYWVHRLLHGRHLWRVHRWHHSPTHLYWLAGIRGTLLQEIPYGVVGLICAPLLAGAPGWVFLILAAEPFFLNNWMHTNVTWRSRWLEWVVVTPRYHHVHHSSDPRHHGMNLSATFTVWDRLFGTYIDPEDVGEISFGVGTPLPPIRVALGL